MSTKTPLHLPNVEILISYVLSHDDCKFAVNLFPISWGSFENINLLYFLLKMQIWNGFNVFNIPWNLIKDINVNLSISSENADLKRLWNVLNFARVDPTNDINVNLSILSVG